jgi:hypothetical protein
MKDGSPSIVVLLDSARSAEPPHSSGMTSSQRREHLAGRRPRRHALGRRRGTSAWPCASPRAVSRGEQPVEQGGAARGWPCATLVALVPLLVRPAPRHDLARVGDHARGSTSKVCSGSKPRSSFRPSDLVVAEGRAVRLAGVLLGRRRPGDDRAQDDRGLSVLARPASMAASQRVDVLDVGLAVAVAAPVDVWTSQPYAS